MDNWNKRALVSTLALLSSFSAFSCGNAPKEQASIGQTQSAIVNGTRFFDADSVNRPVISIKDTNTGKLLGSGVLIAPDVVLLSAHQVCSYIEDASALEVQRGNPDVALASKVSNVVLHPLYVPKNCGPGGTPQALLGGIDLALVYLKTPLFPTTSSFYDPFAALPAN